MCLQVIVLSDKYTFTYNLNHVHVQSLVGDQCAQIPPCREKHSHIAYVAREPLVRKIFMPVTPPSIHPSSPSPLHVSGASHVSVPTIADAPRTMCEKVRDQLQQQHQGAYIPRCTNSGDYAAVQCNYDTGECWCVTKAGDKIPDTARRHPLQPNCDGTGKLQVSPQVAARWLLNSCHKHNYHGSEQGPIINFIFEAHYNNSVGGATVLTATVQLGIS